MNELHFSIHTDGGSRGNPGPAAIGIVIEGGGVGKKEYSQYIGETTNNVAEYQAVVFALKKMKQLVGSEECSKAEITFYVDSELLQKQLSREYKVKDEGIQKLFMEIWNLTMDFKKVLFTHVLREKNARADMLVNQVLDKEGSKLGL